jgi:hypothetical protein
MTAVVISKLEYSAAATDSSIRVSLIVASSSTYLGRRTRAPSGLLKTRA